MKNTLASLDHAALDNTQLNTVAGGADLNLFGLIIPLPSFQSQSKGSATVNVNVPGVSGGATTSWLDIFKF